MHGRPGRDREWEHWPAERRLDDGVRHRLRALFQPTDGERQVEELIATRGRELQERTAQLTEALADLERREERTHHLRNAVERMLRTGSAELDERHSHLNALAQELAERDAQLQQLDSELAERRQELGAVELRRAAVESRERALDERESLLEQMTAKLSERERLLLETETRVEEMVERARELSRREAAAAAESVSAPEPEPERRHLLFVSGERYRLVEAEGPTPAADTDLELEGVLYRVVRTGSSPLPADTRRCAFLEPAARVEAS